MTGFDALCWAAAAFLGVLTLGSLLCGLLLIVATIGGLCGVRRQWKELIQEAKKEN